MSLNEWLERNHLTHEQFAAMCGCTRAAVTRWASGSRMPSPKWLKVIERKTKGQVSLRYELEMTDREKIHLSLYRKGLTISAAAQKLRISRNTLSRFLRKKAETPDDIVDRIYRLAGL